MYKKVSRATSNTEICSAAQIKIQHQIVNTLELSDPTPHKCRWMPSSNVGECPHLLNCVIKTNFLGKHFCVSQMVFVFTLVEKPYIHEIWTF